MQKIFRNEKGSISLFVLLSALFFLVVVTSVGVSFKNKEASVDSQFEKIKTSYEKDVGNEEAVYIEKLSNTKLTDIIEVGDIIEYDATKSDAIGTKIDTNKLMYTSPKGML